NTPPRIGERYKLQYRLESFNVMNSFFVNTLQFNNDPTNTNFGSILKATVSAPRPNSPRQIQTGVKFWWWRGAAVGNLARDLPVTVPASSPRPSAFFAD